MSIESARIPVIINASAGAEDKERIPERLAEIFAANGIDADILLANSGDEMVELARRSARGDSDIIVVGGGDGTIRAVASVLVGTNKTLGVLPLGTFNYFARNLNIPLELEAAARNIAAGNVVNVNIGEVNGQVFLNNSSLGLYPRIIREREIGYGRWGRSKLASFLSGAYTLLRPYRFLKVRLSTHREDVACRTPLVFVNNNAYQGASYGFGGRECLDSAKLALYIAHSGGRLSMLWLGVRALLGRLHEAEDLQMLCAKEAWIESRRPSLRIALDGELLRLDTPLHYRMREAGLRVLAPPVENTAP